jgi:uncharacterized protein (TIGR03083 family)
VSGVDIRAAIADERLRMADLVDGLTPGQLRTPSLCEGWTVRDVIGHLVAAVAMPRSWIVPELARSGFRLHVANSRVARRMARRDPADLAAALREHAESDFKPPVVGFLGPFTDLQVHGQDIRRPLGLPHALLPERIRASLDFLVGGKARGFTPKERPAGLRLEAPDVDWSWGDGPRVGGAGEALMMALTWRPVALAELTGDGVSVLSGRR